MFIDYKRNYTKILRFWKDKTLLYLNNYAKGIIDFITLSLYKKKGILLEARTPFTLSSSYTFLKRGNFS